MKTTKLKKASRLALITALTTTCCTLPFITVNSMKNTHAVTTVVEQSSSATNSINSQKANFKPNSQYNIDDYEVRISYMDILNEYYEQVLTFARDNNIECELTLEEFHNEFYAQDSSIQEFVDKCIDYMQSTQGHNFITQNPFNNTNNTSNISSSSTNSTSFSLSQGNVLSSSSSDGNWYTDIDKKGLLQKPSYNSKFNLLGSHISSGDILHEENGYYGITGHTAIIENVEFDPVQNTNYLRIVEAANPAGVCHGVLDDTRFIAEKGHILRVKSATKNQKDAAVSFCESQLRKGYKIDFRKDTGYNEPNWYCSELVWAGYMRQGIDIEVRGWLGITGEPGITPRDIFNSKQVTKYLSYNK